MTQPIIRKRVNLRPDTVPGGGDQYAEAFHRAQVAINRLQAQVVTNITTVTGGSGVTSLDAVAGIVLLAAVNNVKLSVSGQTITIDGRVGPRFGYRWPSAGADIVIGDDDYQIYGTGAQHCHDVTFPAASSCPGKYIIFTYPPSGSLISDGGSIVSGGGLGATPALASVTIGSDTIDAYANATAAYQSDGVSAWKRVWST